MTTEAELRAAIRLSDGGAAIYDMAYLASKGAVHPAYNRIAVQLNRDGWARRSGAEVVAEAARRFAEEQAKRAAREAQPSVTVDATSSGEFPWVVREAQP